MSEQHAEDLSWLLKQGVASCVRSVLNSQEFGNLKALCQAASIQIGLTQACLEMRDRYPILANEPLLYSYPTSQDVLLDRFMEATGYEYHLLRMLKAGSMDVGSLKKFLEENENGESSRAPEDRSYGEELLTVEEQLKIPDHKVAGEAKQAVVAEVQLGAQVLGGEDIAGGKNVSVGNGGGKDDGEGDRGNKDEGDKGDGDEGDKGDDVIFPASFMDECDCICTYVFRVYDNRACCSWIFNNRVFATGLVLTELVVAGFVITGLALAGFVVAGLALAGFILTGFALAGFMVAGLALAGFILTGFALAGFVVAGLMMTMYVAVAFLLR
ncbi:hypothetical protein LXL04_014513 [Taraxacum kok-saghyz]